MTTKPVRKLVPKVVKAKTTRLYLELSDAAYNRLDRLVLDTEAKSRTEVVRAALLAYDKLVQLNLKGRDVYFVDSQGQRTLLLGLS